MICDQCGKDYEEDHLNDEGEYGMWCDECLDATPGDVTGYCSQGCCLGFGCDETC